ncbi:MAG: hypothetical protein AB1540_05025 [Bdellovibrionota bacterium]
MEALLTTKNYKDGFLIDDETIGGVTEMSNGVFAAYVSHYLTGETLDYREFSSLAEALERLNGIDRKWIYESIGCSSKTSHKATGCSSRGCSKCS